MTLVDSLDSVLMLYAYAGPTQDPNISKFALTFNNDQKVSLVQDQQDQTERDQELLPTLSANLNEAIVQEDGTHITDVEGDRKAKSVAPPSAVVSTNIHTSSEAGPSAPLTRTELVLANKANTISSLSITLTLLSILVALR